MWFLISISINIFLFWSWNLMFFGFAFSFGFGFHLRLFSFLCRCSFGILFRRFSFSTRSCFVAFRGNRAWGFIGRRNGPRGIQRRLGFSETCYIILIFRFFLRIVRRRASTLTTSLKAVLLSSFFHFEFYETKKWDLLHLVS